MQRRSEQEQQEQNGKRQNVLGQAGLGQAQPLPYTDWTSLRSSNFSPAFIDALSATIDMQFVFDGKGDLQATFGPEDVFDYLYAVGAGQ